MDEDLGVKAAPVTRLRKRLSVEPDDSPLPTTPSTPTKKRGTRLAAKPQLELIDEVVTENVPKKTTRKAAAKDAVEPEGTSTPVTPSRRSTRIRSNTSILSETTTQYAESPRAKRALRRNSQLGSDTESAVVTPARQTRRTRKDSSTAADKPGSDTESAVVTPARQTRRTRKESSTAADKPADESGVVHIVTSSDADSKTEGKEKDATRDSKANQTNYQSPSARKSPRLNKKDRMAGEETDKSIKEIRSNLMENYDKNTSPKVKETEQDKLSTSSIHLINEMKTNTSKINPLNKSTSAIERIATDLKNKRKRTKSWTTLTSPSSVGFMSGNDGAKEKIKHRTRNTSISGSGEGLLTNDANKSVSKNELDIKSSTRSINKSKLSLLNSSVENKENLLVPHGQFADFEMNKSDMEKLFEKSPNHQSPFVVIEDPDSCSRDKLIIDIQLEGGDQCVPVVANPTNKSPEKRQQSVEPMDIDESMPLNVTIDDFSDKSNTSKEDAQLSDSKRKSSVSIQSETPRKLSICGEADKNDAINKNSSISSKVNSSVLNKLNDSTRGKSNRSSSISQVSNEIGLLDKSQRKSSLSIDEKLNESSNKSKRNTSISQNISQINQNVNESRKSLDKSQRKSSVSIGEENIEVRNGSSNKSKNKSSISQNISEIDQNFNESRKPSEDFLRKSSVSIDGENVEKLNENSNKSKRKSSVSLSYSGINRKSISDENNDSKSSNKSKRNSSISQTEQNLEKSGNENKSTLVISQLKDVSSNDTNNVMSPNVTNNELSNSGPDVKNKGIDKKNRSLNYLTSTPIHLKPPQNLTMQINTSIISPAVDKKSNTHKKNDTDSDSSVETDANIKFKNENKSESTTFQKKKPPGALSSSNSDSDEKPDRKPRTQTKLAIKNKKVPAPDSSDSSDDESDCKSTPYKKLNESEIKPKADTSKVKTPSKKAPHSESESSDDSDKDSDENSLKNKNNTFDDEASEASDDYQSGDSQNEQDRQYEEENEIVENGETLDSEEELSNDSDYEKDSFLVSSDAEDNEMLSGTGDDLSMSDNELSMSAKSKEKFNERKLKQQKKASREMYEARHNIDESDKWNSSKSETTKTKKTKRQRLESSTLDSENEEKQPNKSNRLRIYSSQDSSLVESEADVSISFKKKKSKRLSESVCEDATINENEITIFKQSTAEKNDPLTVAIKQEPKTPLKQFNMSIVAINEKIEEVQVDSNASIMRQSETLDPLQATMAVDDDDSSSSDNMEIIQNYDSVLNSLSMQTQKIKTVDTSLNLNKKTKHSKQPVFDQLNLTQTKTKKNKTVQDNKPKGSVKAKEIYKVDDDSSDSIDMKLLFPEDSNDSEINASQFKPKDNEPADDFIPLKRTEAKTNIHENIDKNLSLNDSALNVSKKKNKKRKSSHSVPDEVTILPDIIEDTEDIKIIIDTTGTHELDTSMAQTNSSKKKKNKKNKSFTEESTLPENSVDVGCTDGFVETPIETLSKSEKKKNKSFDVSTNNAETSLNITEKHSTKKSKKKSESTSEFIETHIQNIDPEELPAEKKVSSDKKKKKNKNKQNLESSQTVDNTGDDSDEGPMEMSYTSEKKSDATDVIADVAVTPSSEKKKHKKNKKKKNKNLLQSSEKSADNVAAKQDGDIPKKRKRKTTEQSPTATENAILVPIEPSNNKKKRKIHLEDEYISAYNNTEQNEQDGSSKKSKKNKKFKNQQTKQDDVPSNSNNNKRKHRDNDDGGESTSKISKHNLFDEIHVPALPESVLNQLTDKPQKITKKNKHKAIATMPFTVEESERRKNKPSNYLEQSVYLNDSPVETKEQKRRNRKPKPKVLPFTPTVLTSENGYTSHFNINVLPADTQFVAQASNVENFRESYLGSQRIKKLGTLERYKRQRSHKLSKF